MLYKMILLALVLGVATASYAGINVACAANMQYALKEISAVYLTKTGKEITPVFGSAGKLSAQILNGAPFDVFVSADMERVDTLFVKGYAASRPRLYASGRMVMWTLRDLDLGKGLELLKDPAVKSIALGDLKLTVYGPAAQEILSKVGLWESVRSKVVYGENINLVAQYIVNQSADIGFANISFVKQGPMAGKGKWIEMDPALHSPLQQGAAVLRYGLDNNPQEAQAFFAFLYGPESRAILQKHGYLLP